VYAVTVGAVSINVHRPADRKGTRDTESVAENPEYYEALNSGIVSCYPVVLMPGIRII
jgi:hypothetical protein